MVKKERASASNTDYPVRSDGVGIITASLPNGVLEGSNNTIYELMILVAHLCPRYVVIDGQEELVGEKRNINLCRILSSLHTLNYQFRFGILDCAHFGVPQIRKRSIILASLSNYPLPKMPSPITYSPSSPEVLTPIRRITV